jgi:hypothetical protein
MAKGASRVSVLSKPRLAGSQVLRTSPGFNFLIMLVLSAFRHVYSDGSGPFYHRPESGTTGPLQCLTLDSTKWAAHPEDGLRKDLGDNAVRLETPSYSGSFEAERHPQISGRKHPVSLLAHPPHPIPVSMVSGRADEPWALRTVCAAGSVYVRIV